MLCGDCCCASALVSLWSHLEFDEELSDEQWLDNGHRVASSGRKLSILCNTVRTLVVAVVVCVSLVHYNCIAKCVGHSIAALLLLQQHFKCKSRSILTCDVIVLASLSLDSLSILALESREKQVSVESLKLR